MNKYKLPLRQASLIALIIALIVVLCIIPFNLEAHTLSIVTLLLINVIIVVSFRLIATFGGWSLAHIPLMGAGGYFSAIMMIKLGWPFWASMLVAPLPVALIGLAFSYPLAKMKGLAFFIGSFALGEAMRLSWVKIENPFGGVSGIVNIPRPSPWAIPGLPVIDFKHDIPYYFVVLVVMLVCLLIMYRLEKSRIGDTLKAINSQDLLAQCVGINITRYKTLGFVIGSFFAGVAGTLYAHYLGVLDPSLFSFTPTVYLLIWAVVGGTHTFFGPIIGVVIFTWLSEVLRVVAAWRPLVYGFILIAMLIFMPNGLEDLLVRVRTLVERLRSRLSRE
ncbi:branched-chain amino acid ABC transporter permease [Chloroflexota bacterium]